MKRVIFIEEGGSLRIEILTRENQYWAMPVLLFAFPGFFCGLALVYVSMSVLGLLLSIVCVYGLILWLFNCFGKVILIFDNNRRSFRYRKALFGIGITRKFDYDHTSAFVATDSILPGFLRNRTEIWAGCEFEHKGKKFRFGYFSTLEDAEKVAGMINRHVTCQGKKQTSGYPTPL